MGAPTSAEHHDEADLRSAVLPILRSLQRELVALRGLLEPEAAERSGRGEHAGSHESGGGENETAYPGSPARAQLTPREGQVLNLLLRGESNRVIARSLGITVRTVKAHLQSMFRKSDVSCRAELIVLMLSREAPHVRPARHR